MTWKKIGNVAVETGQMLLIDPVYTKGVAKTKYKVSVLTRTGLGDGYYPVYAKIGKVGKWGKRVKEIKIDFLTAKTAKALRHLI